MTTILFLAALLIAIPSSGLSILAYLGFLMAKAFLKAQARMLYADGQQALRDLEASRQTPPTWGSNRDSVQTFLDGVLKLAVREGVPIPYIEMVFLREEFAATLTNLVGEMDKRGRSFHEQQRAAADLIVAAWEKATTDGTKTRVSDFQPWSSDTVS